ncbi:MAG: Lin1244/Lin1753 domain-containing protein [Lachnospiraceae bacterium]
MKIERRKMIDDGIMAELQKKHPVKSEKGVCYAQDMDYITLEVEAFNNSTFRKLVKANNKVLVVYMYLRERMCHNGWYVLWDNDTKEDILERLTLWGVSENDSSSIITTLLDNKIIHNFQHDGIEYLTDVQQIYNWEMLQAKRARDRNSKNKQNKPTTDTNSSNNTQQDYIPQSNIGQHYNIGFDNNYNDDGLPFN